MKRILLGLSLFFITLISAQNYPDYYPTGNNNEYGNGNYYGDGDDELYFPDDYYYEYPADYYSNALYKDYYNDYRRSINDVNWNRFIVMNRLSSWQVQQIIMLNESFPSYSAFNSYYRYNPDRWYYDRFYAMQRILGPSVFVIFQNNYYSGYSPVVYYQNYNKRQYARNVYVIPRYQNVNVNVYKVNKIQYHQSNPRQNIGFRSTPRTGQTANLKRTRENGFRNDDPRIETNTRNNSIRIDNNDKFRIGTVRTESDSSRNNGIRRQSTTPGNNGVFRSGSGNRTENIDNAAPTRGVERTPAGRSNPKTESRTPSIGSKSSAPRFTTR